MFFDSILLKETTKATGEGNAAGSAMGLLGSFLPLILIVVLMYFVMIRPQKKRQKEEQKMRDNLRVGDEVTTIGGIIGRVVAVKEDSITIESGADRTKLSFKREAVYSCSTVHEASEFDDDDDDDDDDI